MRAGNHKKIQEDLEKLNTAAQAGLGNDTPPTIASAIHQKVIPAKATSSRNGVKVAPVMNAGVSASAGAAPVVQRPAPAAKHGKEVERVRGKKVKSAELVVDSDEEAPATKAKGVEIAKAPAPKKKKEVKRAPIEETDDAEYEDEEGTGKGKKKKGPPEHYDLTAARKGQEISNQTLRMPTDPNDPILWDAETIKQAVEDEEFEFRNRADPYVKEARQWEEKEKVNGKTRKKGGKG